MFGTKAGGSSVGYKTDGKHKKTNGNNHPNDSKMCKTKPVLSEAWAELSPPQRKEWSRRNEEELGGGGGGEGEEVGGGVGGFKLDEARIRARKV